MNRKIKHAALPTRPTWKELNYTWDEMKQIEEFRSLSWDSLAEASDKFDEIQSIVGSSNMRDAKHLDSAYRAGCSVFLTSDKDDLWSKRERIRHSIGIAVLHFQDDWPALEALLRDRCSSRQPTRRLCRSATGRCGCLTPPPYGERGEGDLPSIHPSPCMSQSTHLPQISPPPPPGLWVGHEKAPGAVSRGRIEGVGEGASLERLLCRGE